MMKRCLVTMITFMIIILCNLNAQYIQQGNKLFGSNVISQACQGTGVSISSDGNTIAIGGPCDNNSEGVAVWVFTRQNGVWSQLGEKLVGTGAIMGGSQGKSVAISADGNTIIAGGDGDNYNRGAAWIFTKKNGIWTQEGDKLVGEDIVGEALFGHSVAISADGNTAIIGGHEDNNSQGAAWIFIRQNGKWTQQGNKLIGTGNIGASYEGHSVAISADGNTAAIGGYWYNDYQGAVWIFIRQNGKWVQQGDKLVGDGRNAELGISVSITSDGNTVAIGALGEGAVLIFTRQNEVWTQQSD